MKNKKRPLYNLYSQDLGMEFQTKIKYYLIMKTGEESRRNGTIKSGKNQDTWK